MNKKIVYGAIAVTFIVAVLALFVSYQNRFKTGAAITSNLPSIAVSNFAVGSGCDTAYGTCTGTNIAQVNEGICYIKAYATTIAASSTAQIDCQGTAAVSASGLSALTGVQVNDNVRVTLATSTTPTTFLGLVLESASASSTNGYITLEISNFTGTTFTWPTSGTATGTAYYWTTR